MVDRACIFQDMLSIREQDLSGSNLAEQFDKKPPRGNVEALSAGTLREIETA